MEMKRKKEGKEKWVDFEARVGMKRLGGGEEKEGANVKSMPNNSLVQRLSSTTSVTMITSQLKMLKKSPREALSGPRV